MNISNSAHDLLKLAPKTLPQFTTATIKEYVPLLRTQLPVATQLVSTAGTILSREFIEFNTQPQDTFIQEVNLGYYDSKYKGSTYYLVSTSYSQISYRSNNMWIEPTDTNYFLRWTKSIDDYRVEMTYLNQVVSKHEWIRSTIQTNNITTYQPLPSPYLVMEINAGEAIKCIINSTYPIKVYAVINNQEIPIDDPSSILLTNPIVRVYIQDEPNISIPIQITAELIGKYAWTTNFPIGYQNLRTLIHPIEEANKLLPPNPTRQYPTSFWNTNIPNNKLNEFHSRINTQPTYS